jgi:uncharacterized protein (DUF983 family)
MPDLLDLIRYAVWAFLIGASVYATRLQLRAQRAQAKGVCGQCGRGEVRCRLGDTDMCESCATATTARYRLLSRVAAVLAVIAGGAATGVAMRSPGDLRWGVLFVFLVVSIPAGIALLFQLSSKPRSLGGS